MPSPVFSGFRRACLACGLVGALCLTYAFNAGASDWQLTYGQSLADYQATCQSLTNQGFRPICLDVYGAVTTASYSAVWVKDGFTDWLIETNLTVDQFRNRITTRTCQRLTRCVEPAPRPTGIGRKTLPGPRWFRSSSAISREKKTVCWITSSRIPPPTSAWRSSSIATRGLVDTECRSQRKGAGSRDLVAPQAFDGHCTLKRNLTRGGAQRVTGQAAFRSVCHPRCFFRAICDACG